MPTLDWLGRPDAFTQAARVPYRLLQPVSTHGNPARAADNLLIQGDNLEALKSLLPFYRGQVKCIFIDPPYNTQSAFEHYDDNLEHAQWLTLMLPRLQLLRELLREDGSIWVTIDDNEGHYLKVLMDEVFGRQNFAANVFWQKTHTRENRTDISAVHDHVLVFARNKEVWKSVRNLLPSSEAQLDRFTNPDNDPRGPWASLPAHAKAEKGRREAQFFTIHAPSGRQFDPPPGRCWLYTEPRFHELVADSRIWFGEHGNNAPRVKKFLSEVQAGLVPSTFWMHEEVGSNGRAKSEIVELFPGTTPFSTPKPEALLQRILHIATHPADLVLDSFLGSGTTAAVAHKMGRRWIGIEMGEHARTHCLPRLEKVIAGEGGGISRAVGWGQPAADGTPWNAAQQGGGFRFMRLGEPIFDAAGHIHPDVRFATLAAFVWQQETGRAYDPQDAATGARPGTPLLGIHYENMSYPRFQDGRNSPFSSKNPDAAPGAAVPPQPSPRAAICLLFNGILGDKRPHSGNVLTRDVLAALLALHAQSPAPQAPLTVYGEACRLGPARLAQAGVTFRHIPHDVRAG